MEGLLIWRRDLIRPRVRRNLDVSPWGNSHRAPGAHLFAEGGRGGPLNQWDWESEKAGLSATYLLSTCPAWPRKVILGSGFEPQTTLHVMRSTSRCSVSCSYLTSLACPDSAGGDLGRDRVVPRRSVLLSFLLNEIIVPTSQVSTGTRLDRYILLHIVMIVAFRHPTMCSSMKSFNVDHS